MLEVERTGQDGRMATRSDQKTSLRPKNSDIIISKTKLGRATSTDTNRNLTSTSHV